MRTTQWERWRTVPFDLGEAKDFINFDTLMWPGGKEIQWFHGSFTTEDLFQALVVFFSFCSFWRINHVLANPMWLSIDFLQRPSPVLRIFRLHVQETCRAGRRLSFFARVVRVGIAEEIVWWDRTHANSTIAQEKTWKKHGFCWKSLAIPALVGLLEKLGESPPFKFIDSDGRDISWKWPFWLVQNHSKISPSDHASKMIQDGYITLQPQILCSSWQIKQRAICHQSWIEKISWMFQSSRMADRRCCWKTAWAHFWTHSQSTATGIQGEKSRGRSTQWSWRRGDHLTWEKRNVWHESKIGTNTQFLWVPVSSISQQKSHTVPWIQVFAWKFEIFLASLSSKSKESAMEEEVEVTVGLAKMLGQGISGNGYVEYVGTNGTAGKSPNGWHFINKLFFT